jgi:hypothetical protein
MVIVTAADSQYSTKQPAPAPGLIGALRRHWLVWLIVAVAIAFRLIDLGHLPGMQGDEAWYGLQARALLAGGQVEWRTPTGNVPGMIQIGSLALLHALFPPSLLLLRIPTLLSSLAAMAVVHAIGRRFLSPVSAVIALLMMASLPINIAYARFGWDPSHSGLLVLLAVYATWLNRRLLAAMTFALAMTNHPSAVFIAPFLTLSYLGIELARHDRRRAVTNMLSFAALLLLAIAFVMLLSPVTGQYLDAGKSLRRVFNPLAWTDFMLSLAALISGQTSYAMTTGQGFGGASPAISAVILAALIATAGGGLWLALRPKLDWPLLGVVGGWLVSLLLLYLVAGSWVMHPGLERFGLPMLPLTVLAMAAVLGWWSDRGGWGWLAQPLVAAAAAFLLAGFWFHYLSAGEHPRGRPGQGYWTAAEDPGATAFKAISRAAGANPKAAIVAEDWWIAAPIAYYASGSPLKVVKDGKSLDLDSSSPGGTYWVAYASGPLDRSLAGRPGLRLRQTITTNHPLNSLHIWWQAPAPTSNQ